MELLQLCSKEARLQAELVAEGGTGIHMSVIVLEFLKGDPEMLLFETVSIKSCFPKRCKYVRDFRAMRHLSKRAAYRK